MRIKVKTISDSDIESLSIPLPEKKTEPVILTSDYVRELSQGIAHRIQQRELSYIDSAELAAKALFR